MIKDIRAVKLTQHTFRLYGLLVVSYVVLIFLLPANAQTIHAYNLSGFAYRVLLFAVVLPSLLVWFAAFFSYNKLYEYAYSITHAPEGRDFTKLASGCAWLAWSLPVRAITSLILFAIADARPGFHSSAVIISNYVELILPLIGFSLIGAASRSLMLRAKVPFSVRGTRLLLLAFITLGVLYCYLSFRSFNLSGLGEAQNPFHMPIWLAVLTIIIPYLYAWFIGLLAAYEITAFSNKVRGLLYQQPFQLLVGGLIVVIMSSIALQFTNYIELPIGRIVLDYRLVSTLAFRIIGGVGYILIALGAVGLKKIEEV